MHIKRVARQNELRGLRVEDVLDLLPRLYDVDMRKGSCRVPLLDLLLLRSKQEQMGDLSDEMAHDLQSIVDDYGCSVMRLARLVHMKGLVSTTFRAVDPFKWNACAPRELMVREPGKDLFGCYVCGFVDHSDVAAEFIVEPSQGVEYSWDFRDRIVIDRMEVFWRDITQPVGNDDIAQVDDRAAV